MSNPEDNQWEAEFDDIFNSTDTAIVTITSNEGFNEQKNTAVEVKDFIRRLLSQQAEKQREEIASVREETEREVLEIVQENYKGAFEDDQGNNCWYVDGLVDVLTNHFKKE